MFVIIVTANHWWLDGLFGALISVTGWKLSLKRYSFPRSNKNRKDKFIHGGDDSCQAT